VPFRVSIGAAGRIRGRIGTAEHHPPDEPHCTVFWRRCTAGVGRISRPPRCLEIAEEVFDAEQQITSASSARRQLRRVLPTRDRCRLPRRCLDRRVCQALPDPYSTDSPIDACGVALRQSAARRGLGLLLDPHSLGHESAPPARSPTRSRSARAPLESHLQLLASLIASRAARSTAIAA